MTGIGLPAGRIEWIYKVIGTVRDRESGTRPAGQSELSNGEVGTIAVGNVGARGRRSLERFDPDVEVLHPPPEVIRPTVQDLPPRLRDLLQEGPDLVRIAAATVSGTDQHAMRPLGEASYRRRQRDPVACYW
jgi:hypothetical protein